MGKLYVVPTPVGNLEDITLRAIRVLKEADLILAEDTRTSSVLFKKYDIHTKTESHHKFNEHKSSAAVCEKILSGMNVALVSDAGTPGISDPGFFLVRSCLRVGIEVETLPGATAFVPALVNSGYPSDKFCFIGFLPMKKGRLARLEEIGDMECTSIVYESPYRLVKTLGQMAELYGEKRLGAVCREISKVHEECRRGTLRELYEWYSANEPKGEIVIIVAGKDYEEEKREDGEQ